MTSLLRWQRPMTISCGCCAGQVAARLEVGHDRLARGVPVEPVVARARVGDAAVVGQDGRRRRGRGAGRSAWSSWSWAGVILTAPVPKAGSTTSSAMIGTSRSTNGMRDGPADEVRVALVVGVDRDGRVAEDRLGPRRRDGDRRAGSGCAGRRVDRGGSGPTRACRSRASAIDLEVADARPAAGAPVDQRLGAVGEVRRRRGA